MECKYVNLAVLCHFQPVGNMCPEDRSRGKGRVCKGATLHLGANNQGQRGEEEEIGQDTQ